MIDFSASYTERNFITPMRAMTEYLLKQSDLETLPKVLRRSPYEAEPPITVHYRKDVEAKAIEVGYTYIFILLLKASYVKSNSIKKILYLQN